MNPIAKMKKKKPAKAVYPSKAKLNMAMKEKSPLEPKRLIPALIVLFFCLGVFAKFAVLDRLAEVDNARYSLASLQELCSVMEKANADYEEVSKQYAHYSTSWMTDEMKAVIPSSEILALLETHLMPKGQIMALSTSGSTISVDVGNIDLEIAAGFVEDLSAMPTVTDVRVYTAESENPSSKQLRVNFIISMIPEATAALQADQGGDAQ